MSSRPLPTYNLVATTLFVAAVAAVAGVAALLAPRQTPFRSTTTVFARPNILALITGAQDPSLYDPPTLAATTAAGLAPTRRVAEVAVERAKVAGLTPGELLRHVAVTSEGNAVVFVAKAPSARSAARISDSYARAFVSYRAALHRSAVRRAQRETALELARLRRSRASADESRALAQRLRGLDPSLDYRFVIVPPFVDRVSSRAKSAFSGAAAGGFAAFLLIVLRGTLPHKRRTARRSVRSRKPERRRSRADSGAPTRSAFPGGRER